MYFLHIEQMYIYETSLCMEYISCFVDIEFLFNSSLFKFIHE